MRDNGIKAWWNVIYYLGRLWKRIQPAWVLSWLYPWEPHIFILLWSLPVVLLIFISAIDSPFYLKIASETFIFIWMFVSTKHQPACSVISSSMKWHALSCDAVVSEFKRHAVWGFPRMACRDSDDPHPVHMRHVTNDFCAWSENNSF